MINFSLGGLEVRISPENGSWNFGLATSKNLLNLKTREVPSEIVELSLFEVGEDQDSWEESMLGKPYTFEVKRNNHQIIYTAPGFISEFNMRSRRGYIRTVPSKFAAGLDNFLRVVYSYFLFNQGGFLLHAAGFTWADKAYVLFGPSGSGKSTTVSIYQAALTHTAGMKGEIISDDVVQILPGKQGDFLISQSPLESRFPSVKKAWRFAQAFYLVKDKDVLLKDLSPATAVARLIRNVLYISEDQDYIPLLLEYLEKMVEACHVADLHFRPDPEFLKVIKQDRISRL